MEQYSNFLLLVLLFILLLASAFFSGSETGLMASNRFRLRHLAKEGHRGAKRVLRLLDRPDRLLGVILLGNTFANIFAGTITAVLADRMFSDWGILFSTIAITLIMLIFSEVIPKTLAATYPERFAYLIAIPLRSVSLILFPFVWLVNLVANGFLSLFGVSVRKRKGEQFSQEELRSIVNETSYHVLGHHKNMLLGLMDLKQITVDDIMVPRSEIVGIDLDNDLEEIKLQLALVQHTRLPIYRDEINSIKGVLHLRSLIPLMGKENITKDMLLALQQEPYFVPEGTPLMTQLLNFQRNKARLAFVVDEYGEVQGLVTLDDILEEVVGEFTTDVAGANRDILPEEGGSYLLDGSVTVRDLNRLMGWHFPQSGPRTLNGLILEHLERIPEAGTGCRIAGYPMEVILIKDNAVKTVRLYPALFRLDK